MLVTENDGGLAMISWAKDTGGKKESVEKRWDTQKWQITFFVFLQDAWNKRCVTEVNGGQTIKA